eukprot:scaffold29670_cov55-Attheya_sp.AAC.7
MRNSGVESRFGRGTNGLSERDDSDLQGGPSRVPGAGIFALVQVGGTDEAVRDTAPKFGAFAVRKVVDRDLAQAIDRGSSVGLNLNDAPPSHDGELLVRLSGRERVV